MSNIVLNNGDGVTVLDSTNTKAVPIDGEGRGIVNTYEDIANIRNPYLYMRVIVRNDSQDGVHLKGEYIITSLTNIGKVDTIGIKSFKEYVAESDPNVPAHVKAITQQNITDWNGKQDAITDANTLSPNNIKDTTMNGKLAAYDNNGVLGSSGIDTTNIAVKSEMSITDGTGADAGTATIQLKSGTSKKVLTQHQSLDGKVDKVPGKVLSTNDYNNTEKEKVANAIQMPSGATSGKVLGYENGAVAWVDRPQDGEKGDKGDKGEDAVNPFKGYYPSGVSKPATGAVGDYIYAPPSDPQSTATATIWHYDSTQTPPWTDTEIDVSNVVGVEFGSRQSVPATKIKDENGEEVTGNVGVLSAEAGKNLKKSLYGYDIESEGEELVGEGKAIDSSTPNLFMRINPSDTTNFIVKGGNIRGTYGVQIPSDAVNIKVVGVNNINQSFVVFLIKNPTDLENITYSIDSLKSNGFIPSDAGISDVRKWIGKGSETTIKRPEWANYVLVSKYDIATNPPDRTPSSFKFISLVHTNGAIEDLQERTDDIQNDVDSATENIDKVKDLLIDTEIQTLTASNFTNAKVYPSINGWVESSMDNASCYRQVKKGQVLHIEGTTFNGYRSLIRLNSITPIKDGSYAPAQDPALFRVGTGESIDITIENDCWLVIWYYVNTLTNIFPTSITILTISPKNQQGNKETTRANVNICDSEKLTTGIIDTTTGEITSGDGRVTDFLNICLGTNGSYQLTQFIHVCNIDSNGSFGYNSTAIAVYDMSKNFIGMIGDVSSFIDKEDEDNRSLFFENGAVKAKYIRVQFSNSVESPYVCNANDRNLPVYSKYNQEDLYQTEDFVADKIHNSDGALTKMLQAALSYVGRGAVTNLGYGDSNTAFDQTVNAVECDSWNPGSYTGEKKQINCSGFVQLALQGIIFENSRYVLGSDRQNIITNYRFDSKTTYNYHNAAANPDYAGTAHPPIYCSDYGKLYANTLAKYAEDRGFLFKIKDDLSNIEVGDVIFSKVGDASTYRGIGHVLFAANVRKNKDGSRIVDAMEVTGSGVEDLAHVSAITSRTTSYIWAARFPMPVSNVNKIDLISSYTNEQTVDVATSETLLSTLTLTNPLSKANVYTVIGKLSSNPLGKIQPFVKVSGTTFDGSSTTLLQRPDGWFVKHLIIRYNEQIANLSDVKIYVKAEELMESVNVDLEEVHLYKGYVTL